MAILKATNGVFIQRHVIGQPKSGVDSWNSKPEQHLSKYERKTSYVKTFFGMECYVTETNAYGYGWKIQPFNCLASILARTETEIEESVNAWLDTYRLTDVYNFRTAYGFDGNTGRFEILKIA